MMIACAHATSKKFGHDRKGNPRHRCLLCGKTWTDRPINQLGQMQVRVADAKMALRLLAEGMSIRGVARSTQLAPNTVSKLLVYFGRACRKFMDQRMRGLKLDHLQVDEQWTFVGKKQARLTMNEREERHDVGDVYIWTAVDESTKLLPCFLVGKRSGDNARRFMVDLASRLTFPNPHASNAHSYQAGGYQPITQISTDCFEGYREAVDLAFGVYAKYGQIRKVYRNAKMIYTPSDMIGTKRKGIRGILPHEVRDMHEPR